uniref:Uncharacterized protein n=1 Tax=Anopheles merus TaxID=30066 RepID=A0A182V6H2_ANOME
MVTKDSLSEKRIGRVPTLRKWRSGRCVLALAVEDPPKPQWKYRCIASSGQLLWMLMLLLVRFFTIRQSPDWPGNDIAVGKVTLECEQLIESSSKDLTEESKLRFGTSFLGALACLLESFLFAFCLTGAIP